MEKNEATIPAQFLCFKIQETLFAVESKEVAEAIEVTPFAKVPGAPPYLKGMVNCKNTPVPVIDLCLKFGLHRQELSVNTCIIIITCQVDEKPFQLGLLADALVEFVNGEDIAFESAPITAFEKYHFKSLQKKGGVRMLHFSYGLVFSPDELAKLLELIEKY